MLNFGSSTKCFGLGKLAASLCTILLFGTLAGASHAAPVGAPGDLSPGNNVITFEEFALGTIGPITYQPVPNPYPVNSVTISSNIPGAAKVSPSQFAQFAGIFEGQYFGRGLLSYSIDFNGRVVSEFGMGVFDPNLTGNVVRAIGFNGNVLETLVSGIDPEFSVGPAGGLHSTFVGFTRAVADIARIELIGVPGDVLAIDTVTFSNTQISEFDVPEPATGLALLGGLVAMGLWRRQRTLKTV